MERPKNPDQFLTGDEAEQVEAAIARAERRTSAEIKLIIARYCWMGLEKKAAMLFKKHGLDQTEQRNCVLILLVTTERKFLIYGDEGIDEKVGQTFWEDVRDVMGAAFRDDRFGDGLAEGVGLIGDKLAEYFPYDEADRNEISDGVAYDE
ncbi:MAG: TPM domain-containing protein [Planctomycetota bacterium]